MVNYISGGVLTEVWTVWCEYAFAFTICVHHLHSPFAHINRKSHMRVPAGKKGSPALKASLSGKRNPSHPPRERTPFRVTMPAPHTLSFHFPLARHVEPVNRRVPERSAIIDNRYKQSEVTTIAEFVDDNDC